MEARTLAKRYRLEEAIGQGGMGVVHRALDLELDRRVAIKVLTQTANGDDAILRDRFVVEAKRTAGLRHPSIVEVFDVGHDAHDAFLVMELLEGETLSDRLAREERLDADDAVALGVQICDALGAAHDGGFVHRDLKPANVFLVASGDGESVRVKLLDFGIAKRIDGATARTDPATLVGTIEYMAPEQIKGGAIDGRADLYALGLTLYRALTGRHAFSAENVASMIHSQLDVSPPRMRDRVPDAKLAIPAALEGVVLRLLEKEPRRRFENAREVRRALLDALVAKEPAGGPRGESMRMVELEDVPDGVPSLELASKRALDPDARPIAPMVPLDPPPAAPLAAAAREAPIATPVVPGVPSWLEPLSRIPEQISKRAAAYSVIALGLEVVFFGGRFFVVAPLLLLAAGGGLSLWAARRSRA